MPASTHDTALTAPEARVLRSVARRGALWTFFSGLGGFVLLARDGGAIVGSVAAALGAFQAAAGLVEALARRPRVRDRPALLAAFLVGLLSAAGITLACVQAHALPRLHDAGIAAAISAAAQIEPGPVLLFAAAIGILMGLASWVRLKQASWGANEILLAAFSLGSLSLCAFVVFGRPDPWALLVLPLFVGLAGLFVFVATALADLHQSLDRFEWIDPLPASGKSEGEASRSRLPDAVSAKSKGEASGSELPDVVSAKSGGEPSRSGLPDARQAGLP